MVKWYKQRWVFVLGPLVAVVAGKKMQDLPESQFGFIGRIFFGSTLAIAILIWLLNERDKRTNGAVWRKVGGWLTKGGLMERPVDKPKG